MSDTKPVRPWRPSMLGVSMLVAAAMSATMPPFRREYRPEKPIPTDEDLERSERAARERIEAAKAKRRKLEQMTSTPQARARRAEMEAAHDAQVAAGNTLDAIPLICPEEAEP